MFNNAIVFSLHLLRKKSDNSLTKNKAHNQANIYVVVMFEW